MLPLACPTLPFLLNEVDRETIVASTLTFFPAVDADNGGQVMGKLALIPPGAQALF